MELKIIGNPMVGSEAAKAIHKLEKETGAKIIIIEPEKETGAKIIIIEPEKETTIEINGIKYREKQQKQSDLRGSTYMNKIATMALMFNSLATLPYSQRNSRQRPKVDILIEYQLVLAKKSKLSKSDREWVVSQFYNLYEEINKQKLGILKK